MNEPAFASVQTHLQCTAQSVLLLLVLLSTPIGYLAIDIQ